MKILFLPEKKKLYIKYATPSQMDYMYINRIRNKNPKRIYITPLPLLHESHRQYLLPYYQ